MKNYLVLGGMHRPEASMGYVVGIFKSKESASNALDRYLNNVLEKEVQGTELLLAVEDSRDYFKIIEMNIDELVNEKESFYRLKDL
ncbi:MAG TPA: hypothetical protein K8V88_07725 [Companilactobacillus farciminis]|jgi:hypothetical protein|uniref:Uncharacterized protein n=1 Tax=Companilactobacillus farciminis TaxID=1612 RepID=A0A921LAB0_9LACO|nr:hypothetical protein [Companilactobacillus farciminis]WCG36377.1 hypothetical protein PML84_04195 [Companilactobacillus farciminis]HJF87312.1 hypothetical protein [Companilactobacillus farciminis]